MKGYFKHKHKVNIYHFLQNNINNDLIWITIQMSFLSRFLARLNDRIVAAPRLDRVHQPYENQINDMTYKTNFSYTVIHPADIPKRMSTSIVVKTQDKCIKSNKVFIRYIKHHIHLLIIRVIVIFRIECNIFFFTKFLA